LNFEKQTNQHILHMRSISIYLSTIPTRRRSSIGTGAQKDRPITKGGRTNVLYAIPKSRDSTEKVNPTGAGRLRDSEAKPVKPPCRFVKKNIHGFPPFHKIASPLDHSRCSPAGLAHILGKAGIRQESERGKSLPGLGAPNMVVDAVPIPGVIEITRDAVRSTTIIDLLKNYSETPGRTISLEERPSVDC
jgi:hypothetical protein